MTTLRKLIRDEHAATAVEYAVMLGLILMGAFTAIATVGTQLQSNVFDSSAKLGKALTGTSSAS